MRWTPLLLALAALSVAAPASARGYQVEYSFESGGDASAPHAAMLKFGGALYGTAPHSGASGFGAVYAFDPASGAETVVYSFTGAPDGAIPFGGLVGLGGLLYGTTVDGGGDNFGTVYSLDPATGSEVVIHPFIGLDNGAYPSSELIAFGGLLYGTTDGGGPQTCTNTCGTVFSVDPATGDETVVYAFKDHHDGAHPYGGLIEVGGFLYGTTQSGGSPNCTQGCGTVFRVNPATGEERVIYAFQGGADGAVPTAGLIDVGGVLYGTTPFGGGDCAEESLGCGTVFSLVPASGAKTVIHAFQGPDGEAPAGRLVAAGGLLYGVTSNGGHRRGVVYALDPASGTETLLHVFRGGGDGAAPMGGLTSAARRLFGTTSQGGASPNCQRVGCGTVFSIRP